MDDAYYDEVYTGLLYCHKCKYKPDINRDEKKIQEHHMFPKYLGGTDKDPRVHLCKDCHMVLHKVIIDFSREWLKKDDRYNTPSTEELTVHKD